MGDSPPPLPPLRGRHVVRQNIDETVKLCNRIQNCYWRIILNVPESCPKLALLCEPFQIDMKFRIWTEMCQLLMQVKCLDDKALAKQIYKQA